MMPGVGFEEMLVLAVVAIVVIGPKDLPLMMRKFGRFTAKMRAMAFDFKQSIDELGRQAELEELRKEVAALKQNTGLEDLQNDLRRDQAEIDSELRAALSAPETPTPTPPTPTPETPAITHPAINGNGNGHGTASDVAANHEAVGEAAPIAPYPGLSAEHPGYDTGEDLNGHGAEAEPAPLPAPAVAPVKQDTPA